MAELIFTDQNFKDEVLTSPVPTLVDIWAPWCGPCRLQGPVVEELANDYQDKPVRIGKLNADENPTITTQFNVLSIPTLLIFKNGKVVEQFIGVQPKDKLAQALTRYM